MATRRRCTRFLPQQSHQTLVRRRRAEPVLRHPHLHPPLRRGQSLRQCVPLARTFRRSTDSPSVLPRKYRSYLSFDRAGRAGLSRTCWRTALFLYYSDSNTDHRVDWESSTVGMAWTAVGYTEWQLNLVLPGYEERVQYYPKGSKPYLMCNDNKRAKNSHGSGNHSNTSDGSDRSNQGQGGNSQNQSGYGNQGNQGGGRGKQRGHQNPNANQYQGRGSGGKGKYNPPQGHNPPSNTQPYRTLSRSIRSYRLLYIYISSAAAS